MSEENEKKMSKKKKIGLAVLIIIVGFFGVGFGSIAIWSIVDPEGYDKYKQENENDRPIQEKEIEQQSIETSESRFDPELVELAKKNIPDMQKLPREVLQQCKNVDNYDEYLQFNIAISMNESDLIDTLELIDSALLRLELNGYDQHPEVGVLIEETRQIARDTSTCIIELIERYK